MPSRVRFPDRRTRARLFPVAVLACLALAACNGSEHARPAADSALARDLALANAVVPQPALQDVPLAPAPQAEASTPAARPAPARPRTVQAPAQAPARSTPRPQSPSPEPRVAERVPAADRDDAASPGSGRTPGAGPGFAAGTRFPLTTHDRVCTVSGRPGDKIVATLREDVRGTGGAVIRAGTTIVLEVATTEAGDPPESGRIHFRVRALDVDERSYPARGRGEPTAGLERAQVGRVNASDRRKVITGAVAGAILGRVLGGDARGAVIGAAAGGAAGAAKARNDQLFEGCLPAGSPVQIVLEDGVRLS